MALLLPETSATFACPCNHPHAPRYVASLCRTPVDVPFGLCDDCRPHDRRRDEDPRLVMARGELRRRQAAPRPIEIPF